MIGSFREKEIQIKKEERKKGEEVSLCVEQSDDKVVLHSNLDEEACLLTSDLNLSFSSVSLSQKIKDEFLKKVFSGLPSIKVQDHQFESIFNRPKDPIDYSSWRTCVVRHAIYNIMAKIRGRILFKRRGMMRSEVLYRVWSHGKSWGESRSSGMTSTATNRPNQPEAHCRNAKCPWSVFCFIFGRLLMFPFQF